MSEVDLSIKFMGLDFKNPYILAPAPPTWDAKRTIKGIESGWAGAIPKTFSMQRMHYTRPRHALVKHRGYIAGLASTEEISEYPVEWWEKEIAKVLPVAKKNDARLGASIMTEADPESWAKLARRTEEMGVDFIELNLSCPIGVPDKGMGMSIARNSKLMEAITHAVKKAVSVPVMNKLTPNVADVVDTAMASKKGGADAVSAIAMYLCIPRVDVETGTPIPNVRGYTTPSCVAGPLIRPMALRAVAEIRNRVGIPVAGMGGVEDWRSSVEFIMCGADALQVATVVMLYGFDIVNKWMKDLRAFMERKGYSCVDDFKGVAAKKIVPYSDIEVDSKVVAFVDEKRCTGCGLCVYCLFDAIEVVGKKAKIDRKKCNGCGQCMEICPVNAVSFRKL